MARAGGSHPFGVLVLSGRLGDRHVRHGLFDSIRSSTSAGSGHPTSSMSAADLLAVLVARHLRQSYRIWVLCEDNELAEGSIWEALD